MVISRNSITLDQQLVALRENDRYMVRRQGEEKKSFGDVLYSEGSNRGKTNDKGYMEGVSETVIKTSLLKNTILISKMSLSF